MWRPRGGDVCYAILGLSAGVLLPGILGGIQPYQPPEPPPSAPWTPAPRIPPGPPTTPPPRRRPPRQRATDAPVPDTPVPQVAPKEALNVIAPAVLEEEKRRKWHHSSPLDTEWNRNHRSPWYDLSYTPGLPECHPHCFLPDLKWEQRTVAGRKVDQFGTFLDWDATDWGKRKYPARVACMLGCGAHEQKARDIITDTWGRHCDGLFFVVSAQQKDKVAGDTDTRKKYMYVQMQRPDDKPGKKRTNYWEKVWRMWRQASDELLDQYDWFYKGDTDTFCSVPNMRRFVRYHNPDESYYFGHTHLARWSHENGFFNAGSGYILSRGALRRLGHVLHNIRTTQLPTTYPSHCVDRPGAGEDITLSFCLRAAGVVPMNTLDGKLRQRFLTFQWKDHYREMPHPETVGKRVEGDYFWHGKPRKVGHLTDCCAEEPITFHNYKAVGKSVYIQLEQRFSANASTPETVPPTPQCFLYDETLAPKHDAHRNSPHVPFGQVTYTRAGEMECKKPNWSEFTPTRA